MHCANELSYVPLLLRSIRRLLQPCTWLTTTIVLEAILHTLRLRRFKAIGNPGTALPPSTVMISPSTRTGSQLALPTYHANVGLSKLGIWAQVSKQLVGPVCNEHQLGKMQICSSTDFAPGGFSDISDHADDHSAGDRIDPPNMF